MMTKLAALTLALLMTLSMAACGSQKDDQAGGNVTPRRDRRCRSRYGH